MYGLGVTRDPKRRGKQFRARLNHRGVLDLGRFDTAEEARMAYDQAVRTVRCDRKTNYPLHACIPTHPGVQQKVEQYIRLQEVLTAFRQSTVAAAAPGGSTAGGSNSAASVAPPAAAGLPHNALLQAATSLGKPYEHPAPAAAVTDQQAEHTQSAYMGRPAQEPRAASTMPFLQQQQHTAPGPRPNLSAGSAPGPVVAASWSGGVAAEGPVASSQMRAAPVLQLQDTGRDTDLAALLAEFQREDSMPLLQASTPAAAAPPQQQQQAQAQPPTPSSPVAPWPAAVQEVQAPQQTQVLAGPAATGCYAPPAGDSEAAGVQGSASPQQYAVSEEHPGLLSAFEGGPHARNPFPVDACAGASNRQDSQQQPLQPLTRALPFLSSAGDVASYADLCATQLMQLYQRLAQHTQQHTGVVVISWIAAVRANMTVSSSSPQSVRAAVLYTCVHLVSLSASGGVGASCLRPTPLSSRELLVSVVEGLMHTLLSLKMLCAEASTGQGHFSDMLESFRQQVQAGAAGSSVGEAVASLLGWL